MNKQFTTKRDIISAFANAMNLISPEVKDHHDKVSYLSYRLAEAMGMSDQQKMNALAGGLLSSSIVKLLIDNYEPINKSRDVESRSASKKYQEILAGK